MTLPGHGGGVPRVHGLLSRLGGSLHRSVSELVVAVVQCLPLYLGRESIELICGGLVSLDGRQLARTGAGTRSGRGIDRGVILGHAATIPRGPQSVHPRLLDGTAPA
jgi:hypothetical protein